LRLMNTETRIAAAVWAPDVGRPRETLTPTYMDRPPVSLAWGCSQWRARATRMGSWRIQVTMVEDMGCGSSEGECF
jgi:hypothetical protein